jgi:mannose-6-phosphate isomerase-like protein (cupin superfamily)
LLAGYGRLTVSTTYRKQDELKKASKALQMPPVETLGPSWHLRRIDEVVETDSSTLDAAIPGFQRSQKLIFGSLVGNAASSSDAAFSDFNPGYNMSLAQVPPLSGNALHGHKAPERFICARGRFRITHGMPDLPGGQHEVELDEGDSVTVPPMCVRSFTNTSESKDACILTIVPGESFVQWHQATIDQAIAHGANCDEHGQLLPVPPGPAFQQSEWQGSTPSMLKDRTSRTLQGCLPSRGIRLLPSDEASNISVAHCYLGARDVYKSTSSLQPGGFGLDSSRPASLLFIVMSPCPQQLVVDAEDRKTPGQGAACLKQWDCVLVKNTALMTASQMPAFFNKGRSETVDILIVRSWLESEVSGKL